MNCTYIQWTAAKLTRFPQLNGESRLHNSRPCKLTCCIPSQWNTWHLLPLPRAAGLHSEDCEAHMFCLGEVPPVESPRNSLRRLAEAFTA